MKIIQKENQVSRSTKNNGYRRKTIGYRSPCISSSDPISTAICPRSTSPRPRILAGFTQKFMSSDSHLVRQNERTKRETRQKELRSLPFRPWNSANRPTMKFSSWTWCSIPPKVSSILKLVSYFSKVLRYW